MFGFHKGWRDNINNSSSIWPGVQEISRIWGKDVETRKQIAGLQKRVSKLSLSFCILYDASTGKLAYHQTNLEALPFNFPTLIGTAFFCVPITFVPDPCTVFNHFILNSHKNLVFSCDFVSLPDASHGDQSSRSSRCWVSGFHADQIPL